MIHAFLSAEQILSQAGYECEPLSPATTVNDLRLLLKLRSQDLRIPEGMSLIDVDYFLIADNREHARSETSVGGSPICNLPWSWPTLNRSPLQYIGRINLCDSVDILPKRFAAWGKRYVSQIFIPEVYMSDPEEMIVIQTVDLNKPIYQVTDSDLPCRTIKIPKFSMIRTRVKCDPTMEYDDVLEELAACNLWYPQGTRVPAFDAEADSFHVDFSGLDLYAEKGSERLEELGVDIDSIDPAALGFLQLSGEFLTVHAKYGEQVRLKGTMEYD